MSGKCSVRITVSRGVVALVLTEPLPGSPSGIYRRTVRARLTDSLRAAIGKAIAEGDQQAGIDAVLDAGRRVEP